MKRAKQAMTNSYGSIENSYKQQNDAKRRNVMKKKADYLTQGTNMGYNPNELYGVTGGQTGPSAFPKKKNLKINKNK